MSHRGVVATVVAGVALVAALLVASLGAPVAIVSRPSRSITSSPRLPTSLATDSGTSSTPTGTPGAGDAGDGGLAALLALLLGMLALAVVVGLVVLLVTWLRSIYRKPTLTVHREPDFREPPVPDELLASAAGRVRRLESGEPRNAIVASWLDLEQAAADTGLPREPAETSTEYTARVIGVWQVDRARLDDLAALYREARFSRHDLGEPQRRRAIDDLEVLRADLERVALRQRETSPPTPTQPAASPDGGRP